MNIGDVVMIRNQEQYEKMAVKIIEINGDNYTVKVLKNDVQLIVKIEDLKRKKCVLVEEQNLHHFVIHPT